MQRARLAVVALLAGVVIGLSGTAAHAAITYSSWTSTGSWQGYSHTHRSWVDNGSRAGGLSVAVSPAAPAGWIGVTGYLFRGAAICASATPVYSSSGVSGLSRSASGNCGAGQYRGYGNAKAYTGTTYFSKNSPYSPYLSW